MHGIQRTFILSIGLLSASLTAIAGEGLSYPQAKRGDQVDEYHGVKVADPYRWLEDDVRTSKEVADWVAAENQVTFKYLEAIPEREKIRKRLTELWNYEKYSPPVQGRRPVLLLEKRRPAESGRALRSRFPGRETARADRSERMVEGRHPRAGRPELQRRRKIRGLRRQRGRFRLEYLAGAGNRHRQIARRRTQVDQIERRILDQGRQRLFLQPLSRTSSRAKNFKRRISTRRFSIIAWARRNRKTN